MQHLVGVRHALRGGTLALWGIVRPPKKETDEIVYLSAYVYLVGGGGVVQKFLGLDGMLVQTRAVPSHPPLKQILE